MLNKSIIALSTLLLTSSALAMPDTTIEKTYYATAAKEQIVGYFYQGCVASSRVSWGVRTIHYDTGLFPIDCTIGVPDSDSSNLESMNKTTNSITEEHANMKGTCVVRGIANEIRNDGEISSLDFSAIKSSC